MLLAEVVLSLLPGWEASVVAVVLPGCEAAVVAVVLPGCEAAVVAVVLPGREAVVLSDVVPECEDEVFSVVPPGRSVTLESAIPDSPDGLSVSFFLSLFVSIGLPSSSVSASVVDARLSEENSSFDFSVSFVAAAVVFFG